jgi:tetratricopeptide (TPR) repeat protein
VSAAPREPAPGAAGSRAPSRRAVLAALLLSALGLLAFRNSLDVPFVFDDEPAITDNPRIRTLWPSGPANYAIQSTESGRPLVRLSLALNYALGELEPGFLAGPARALGLGRGGLDVRGYHVFNLLVHVLSALVLYGIAWRTLRRPDAALARFHRPAPLLALALAALWLVHPLQTDAVTYTIQRTELLMGLFYLLTLYAALRALDAPRAWPWSAAAVASCALGMLSKEAMASAPVVVALYDRAFVFPSWRAALRRRGRLYAGLASTWAILALLVAQGARDQTVGFDLGVAWWQYLATQAGMILHYLRLSLWPEPLCLDYGRALAEGAGEILPGALVVGALALATLWALRSRPALGFLGAWFFLILAPSSSVVPIVTEVGAERRMHLPLAAVLALVLLGAYRLAEAALRGRGRPEGRAPLVLFTAGAGLLVLGACALTVRRNADFQDELSLWQDTVAKRPDNPAARNNLGRALARRGRLDEAALQFTTALGLPTCPPDALVNLGNVLTDLGRLDQASDHFEQVLRLDPGRATAHEGLAAVRLRQERWAEAVAEYEACLAAGHRSADIHSNLGKALFKAGRVPEAIRHMKEALALDPRHAIAARNLALVEGSAAGSLAPDGAPQR